MSQRIGFGTKGEVANAVVEPRLYKGKVLVKGLALGLRARCKGKVLVKGLALGLRARWQTSSSSQDSAREKY